MQRSILGSGIRFYTSIQVCRSIKVYVFIQNSLSVDWLGLTVMNAVAFVADDALLVIPGWEVCAFAFCRFRPLIPIIITLIV